MKNAIKIYISSRSTFYACTKSEIQRNFGVGKVLFSGGGGGGGGGGGE